MLVDEQAYFSFVTFAILALYLGFKLLPVPDNEGNAKLGFKENRLEFEFIGERLIWIGYLFFMVSFVQTNFIIVIFAFLRFIGSIYIWFSDSTKKKFYMVLVWIPFILMTFKTAVFVNLIVWATLLYCLYVLNTKIKKWVLYSLFTVSLLFLIVLQTVKHQYREVAWNGRSTETVSMAGLFIKQIRNSNTEVLKLMSSALNTRVSQGWIVSHGLNNLDPVKHEFEPSFVKKEMIGILLPRFLFPDKIKEGSKEKFKLFTGWELASSTSMNISIIGDAYLNFGKKYGIIACFILGLFFAVIHRFYRRKLIRYPDLVAWSVLFYFMIMRAGNEFYSIMNWYIKTGLVTVLFFIYVRPFLLELYRKNSFKKQGVELNTISPIKHT